ncbi:mucin-2 isoform X2 [Corythoichthys intestinalis]|uniref:mucin-2 isoform X2 n=1 Tax=Corythoichthys intestinalis TaxID=161448 RepID=UPI0025A6519B|nr:mucin-2 isoform X2 [Corythoichthys intestinalis]
MLLYQLAVLAALAVMVKAIDHESVNATAVGISGNGDNATGTVMLDPLNSTTTSMQPTSDLFTTTRTDETSIKNTYTNITSSLSSAIPTTTSPPGNTVTTRPPDPTDYIPTTTTVTHIALTTMREDDTTWMTTTSASPSSKDMSIKATGQTNYYTSIANNNGTVSMTTLGPSMTPNGLNNKTTMMVTAGQSSKETISMSSTSSINNDISFTTVGLTTNETTPMMTISHSNTSTTLQTSIVLTNNNITSMTTNSPIVTNTSMATGLNNGETTSMTTISLTSNGTTLPTITTLTNNNSTSMTTNSLMITDPSTATGLTKETTSMTTISLTNNSPPNTGTSMTTNSPTNNNTTSLTTTGPTDNTTLMTPATPTITDTTGITTSSTNISTTPIDDATSSTATATLTDTWNTTATQSFNDTTTAIPTSPAETPTSITLTSPALSTATSGATTYEPTSDHNPTSANNATQTPPISTKHPTIVCPMEQCPTESICLNGTCQCLSGSHLVAGRCTRAQVFAGHLHLTSLTFKRDMLTRSSKVFQDTAANISAALAGAFAGQHGYIRSDVVQLAPGSVIATVSNIFENTLASQENINQVIKNAIVSSSVNDLLANATFIGTELCDLSPFPCDASTAVCSSSNGLVSCSCKGGYISTVYSNTSCKACPSGEEVVGNSCQRCPFGYAGFNCTDSSLLAVVVVSCVLGGILLILILVLLSYCCWLRCSRSQADQSDASPYPASELSKPWPVGITPIPRATTPATWDATSAMEMMDKRHHGNGVSGSYNLNPDGMKTFHTKNPSRYSYLVQGHENPYFLPGDDKRN